MMRLLADPTRPGIGPMIAHVAFDETHDRLLALHLTVVVAVLVTGAAMLLVLGSARHPQSCACLIVAFVAIPYVSLPLFVLLGFRGSVDSGLRRSFCRLRTVRLHWWVPDVADPDGLRIATGPTRERPDAVERRPSRWTALIGMVKGATARIDIELYLIANDVVGKAFVDLLIEKATRRRCQVRVMVPTASAAGRRHVVVSGRCAGREDR